MNTIEELVYYCNEPDPVGALMLTGEWGCGKTYLLAHQLVEELKDTHIIVRVSLFGIDSIDTLNTAVKKQWAIKCTNILGKIQDHDKAVNVGKSIFGTVAAVVPVLKDIKDSILAINPVDYISVKPTVGTDGEEKKVILVFDDLERSKLDTVGVLGCINEYCENLHFNTIIVANEDKIEDADAGISYPEIKEKIIARTIHHEPDYESIVASLIDDKVWFDEKYTAFLRDNKPLIKTVFSTEDSVDEEGNSIERPHNIRSLKCALQDFHRLYVGLAKAELPELDKYLYSFIAYTLAAKSGIVKEGKYGYLFTEEPVKKRYTFYNDRMMLHSAKDWIHHGEWDEEQFEYEIEERIAWLKDVEPKDLLRTNRFIDLEETTISEGFDDFLNDVYEGNLTLNEYVNLIENSYFIREYNISVPTEIDWQKVEEGVQKRFERNIDEHDDEHHVYQGISDNNKPLFTEAEWGLYEKIKGFRESDQTILEGNRNLYIDEIRQKGISVFTALRSKRLSVFDNEMASITANAFDHSIQSDKSIFPGCFSDVWETCDSRTDIKKSDTVVGFEKLVELLIGLQSKYKDENRNIAARHTEVFIEVVRKLIEKLRVAIDEENKSESTDI